MIDKNIADKIDPKHIREIAEKQYKKLEFYCSEAIVKTFIDELDLTLPKEVIAMSSGFPLGFGQAGCSCGAITGGLMVLGYFFGRTKAKDTKIFHMFKLAKDLHDKFKDNHGNVCCRLLTKDLKFMSKKHLEQCVSFTGEVAEEVANIIKRELSETKEDSI